MKAITTETVLITPELATKWLEGNTHNRTLSQATVREYSVQMAEKLWVLNGEAIIFDSQGVLVDGQHRLWACIESDAPFKSLVTRGVTPEAFATIDRGHKRSAGDVLFIDGVAKNARIVAAVANTVMRYDAGTMLAQRTYPASVTMKFVREHQDICEWVDLAVNKKSWTKVYATSLSAVGYLAGRQYNIKAREFINSFVSGENLSAGSPVLTLRNRLATEKNMRLDVRTALVAHAWNGYIAGKTLTRLILKGDKFPIIKGA